jgi:hypothetical protein
LNRKLLIHQEYKNVSPVCQLLTVENRGTGSGEKLAEKKYGAVVGLLKNAQVQGAQKPNREAYINIR